jgi:pimeloyl-ACP methyl ester carboxylesterase
MHKAYTSLFCAVLLGCIGAKRDAGSSGEVSRSDDTGTGATQDTGELDADTNTWFASCPRDEREQRMIDVGEVRLNVACRGSGPTVVFLHGFPEWHYSWNGVMDELVDEYRLIAPDQRGYNLSDKPEDVAAYELPKLTQDVLNLLPLISETPVILVAHDWGGPVGWMVAHTPDAHIRGFMATNGPHPIRFADLIATDPDQQAASSYMDLFRSEGAESLITPEFLAGWFPFLSAAELDLYRSAWAQEGAITGGLNWYRANTLEPTAIAAAMAGRSETIEHPVTVLWGEDDTAVLVQNAEGLEAYAPDLEVETFPGVDHWIEHHIPGEVARAIRELDAREPVL